MKIEILIFYFLFSILVLKVNEELSLVELNSYVGSVCFVKCFGQ
jgi:hypothetical protein